MFLGFAFVAMLGETMPGAPPPAVVAPPALIQAEPPEPRREPDATPPKLLNKSEIFTQENYPFWARDLDEEGLSASPSTSARRARSRPA